MLLYLGKLSKPGVAVFNVNNADSALEFLVGAGAIRPEYAAATTTVMFLDTVFVES